MASVRTDAGSQERTFGFTYKPGIAGIVNAKAKSFSPHVTEVSPRFLGIFSSRNISIPIGATAQSLCE